MIRIRVVIDAILIFSCLKSWKGLMAAFNSALAHLRLCSTLLDSLHPRSVFSERVRTPRVFHGVPWKLCSSMTFCVSKPVWWNHGTRIGFIKRGGKRWRNASMIRSAWRMLLQFSAMSFWIRTRVSKFSKLNMKADMKFYLVILSKLILFDPLYSFPPYHTYQKNG